MNKDQWEKLTPDEKSTICRFVGQQTGKTTPPIEIIRHLQGSDHNLDDDQMAALRTAAAGEMITNNFTGELRILVRKPVQTIAAPIAPEPCQYENRKPEYLGGPVVVRPAGGGLSKSTREDRIRAKISRDKAAEAQANRAANKPVMILGMFGR